jgi:hypothetical protein
MPGRLTDTENLVCCVRLKCRQGMSIRSSCAGLSSRRARVGTYNVEATSAERQEDSVIAIS